MKSGRLATEVPSAFKVNADGAVHDWFLVSIVLRFERSSSKSRSKYRRCLVWENVLLINAPSASLAFDKAVKIGKDGCTNVTDPKTPKERQGTWYFTGVSELLPICETLEDGSELMWTEYRNTTVSRAKDLTLTKAEWLRKFQKPRRGRKNNRT